MAQSGIPSTGPERIVLPDPPAELGEALGDGAAIAWGAPLTIRTYEPEEPSRYPMFLDRRVYQGSSGKVYPLPFIEGIADTGSPRDWDAIHLENRYVRLVVLPELGGRIHVGYDKTNDYDFFYRNNVIKPALVGLAGSWISGGVEFNWPQHHRPATFLPVEACIEEADDGSVTVWCHDHDPFTRMSAHHGIRLRPDSSVVELVVRLHNRTDERQSFLWWANVAARVHDDYQSFYPQDIRYVADRARRAITAFPSADRPYYNVDYPALARETPGADRIDYYRNIPVPTSYMIVDSQQDFFGGYDHAAGAGFVHWAERRVSPGKKQWTWGNAPFGHAWDDQLTDGDGPYVELMAGVYTDNQPDFSWLLPGETKTFSQYWYPIPAIGVAHQATPDAAVHVDQEGSIDAAFAVTIPQPGAVMRILRGEAVVATRTVDLTPGVPARLREAAAGDGAPAVELLDRRGRILVSWEPAETSADEPWVAEEPPAPEEITSVDELYLVGIHLAQYRHPTRSPLPYWTAALDRDPGDVRTNLAVADHHYRSGRFAEALSHVEAALARLTRRNANPTDGEGFYLAGLILERLGRTVDAERAFGKAGWDGTWAAAAGLALARSLARRGADRSALRVLDSIDGVVAHDSPRTALRAILLQRTGDAAAAAALLDTALRDEPLDAALRVLAGREVAADAGLLLDVALDLRKAGARDLALHVLAQVRSALITAAGNVRPIAHYVAAEVYDECDAAEAAARERADARRSDLTRAFPSGLDALQALDAAVRVDPGDSAAHALRGTLLYATGRRADAARAWTTAIELGREDPVLLRNAGLAASNVDHDDEKASTLYERAVALAPDDARLRYEQDQLASRRGRTAAERLAALSPVRDLVLTRDDLTIEYIRLLIATGRPQEALDILVSRSFHPWEGGEGSALAAWDAAREALGLPLLDPPATIGEARPLYAAPAAVRVDGVTDYFATSLPELLLFDREARSA
jgi:tetratricopeptide (TPR) repeat protein